MIPYRVLVVDDRPEMRDVMRSNVESLGDRVEVVAVPSGEEALLEIQLKPFDLLVADVLLPGINGMELMNKAKVRSPEMKVILVTGVLDRQLRHAAAGAGADAFFLKPMAPDEFLTSVEQCLGLVEMEVQEPKPGEGQDSEETVSERLARLHRELSGIALVLTDEHGRIQAQAGELPDPSMESGLLLLLIASLSATRKVVMFTGSNIPKGLSYVAGRNFDIIAAHVGDSFALIAFIQPINGGNGLGHAIEKVYSGVMDLEKIILKIGIPENLEDSVDREVKVNNESDYEVDTSEVDALFEGAQNKLPGDQEINAYWESATRGSLGGGEPGADMLTFDQAQQLGIAPEDQDDREI
jgi:CheY-like chemotaxis protein